MASSFGIQDSGLNLRDEGFGIQDSGFGFRVSGFRLRDSGFGFRVSGVGPCEPRGQLVRVVHFSAILSASRIPGFGFRAQISGVVRRGAPA